MTLPNDTLVPPTAANNPEPSPALQSLDDRREQVRRELEHRFRHTLRSGQLSPLLHLVMRYKMEQIS